MVGPDTPGGPVRVGRDLVIQGTPPDNDFVFDGLFRLTVGRNLQITDRSVTFRFTIGGDTVGRDIIVKNDTALTNPFFGASSLNVTDNSVGRDLIFTGNTALDGGSLVVSHNIVGRDAICANNDPPPADGNVVGRTKPAAEKQGKLSRRRATRLAAAPYLPPPSANLAVARRARPGGLSTGARR